MEETNSQSAVSLSTNSTAASSSQDEAEQKDEFPLNDYLLEGVHQESAQRSLLLCRQNFETSFGFALQSYVFKRTSSNSFERITYVDYVSTDSPADRCGIIRGDMVVAVNEKSVVTASHAEIVESIAECLQVSLVLVFKDVARIVELSMRSIQLKFMLEAKTRELKILEEKEKELMEIFGDSTKNSSEISEEAESEESTLYELDEELKNVQNCEGETDYRHLIRINSSTSVGTPQVTRL